MLSFRIWTFLATALLGKINSRRLVNNFRYVMLTGVAIVFFGFSFVSVVGVVILLCSMFFFNRTHTNWSPGRVLEEKGKENL